MKNIIIFCTFIIILIIISLKNKENFIVFEDSIILPIGSGIDLKKNNKTFYRPITVGLTLPVVKVKTIATWIQDSSLYWNYAKTLSKLYPIKPVPGLGSVNNVERVINGEVNFAISQEDVVIDALIGKKTFNKGSKKLSYICGLFEEKVCLIVNPSFNIKNWRDLKGKTVCFGKKGSGSLYNALELCKLIGINESNINIVYGSIYEKHIINSVLDNTIHAIYLTVEQPNTDIISLLRIKLLTIIGSIGLPIGNVVARFPSWKASTIDLSEYGVPDLIFKIPTFAINTILICRKNEDYNSVYKLLNTIFSNTLYIRNNIGNKLYKKVLYDFSISRAFSKHTIIPIHPAVNDYYKILGMSSTNPNPNCSFFAGTGICNLDLINIFENSVDAENLKPKSPGTSWMY